MGTHNKATDLEGGKGSGSGHGQLWRKSFLLAMPKAGCRSVLQLRCMALRNLWGFLGRSATGVWMLAMSWRNWLGMVSVRWVKGVVAFHSSSSSSNSPLNASCPKLVTC